MNHNTELNLYKGILSKDQIEKGLDNYRRNFPKTATLLRNAEDPQLKRALSKNLGHRSLQAPSKPFRPVIIANGNVPNPAMKLTFGVSSRKSTRKSQRKSQRKSKKKLQRKSHRRY
jgi:hypothetical protein